MKVVRQEDGKEVIYVQVNDMFFLNMCGENIPTSIFDQLFGQSCNILTNHNKFDYIKFANTDEVEYFKGLDFIINYDDYKNLSLEGLKTKLFELSDNINLIGEKYNAMNIEDRIKNAHLVSDYEKLEHQYCNITMFYTQKFSRELSLLTDNQMQKCK